MSVTGHTATEGVEHDCGVCPVCDDVLEPGMAHHLVTGSDYERLVGIITTTVCLRALVDRDTAAA